MLGLASLKRVREITIVIIICAIAAAFMLRNSSRSTQQAPVLPPSAPAPASPQTSASYAPTLITVDSFVAQLPSGLIAEQGMTTEQSRKILDAAGASLISGTYISSESLSWNIEKFNAYLKADGWTIKHAANPEKQSGTFFYAVKDAQVLNITFAPIDASDSANKMIRVSIAYKAK